MEKNQATVENAPFSKTSKNNIGPANAIYGNQLRG